MDQATLQNAFSEVIKQRRSVRGFLPKAASAETLDSIFSLAARSPSNCNTQPWVTHIASGPALETLREKMVANTMEGKMSLDYPYEPKYPGVYQERQFDAANQLYSAMDIKREDKAKREEVFMRNYQFFGAPHAAFLFFDERFGLREAADVGMYAQSLMLSITAHGLASVPQTSLGFHADLVREVLGIDSNYKLLFGISFGYEDTENPINNARTGRAELSENTFFHN